MRSKISENSASKHWIGVLCLVLAILTWSLGLPAAKYGLHEWPPLFFRGTAGVVASLCLVVVALASGERIYVPGVRLDRLLIGAATNVFAFLGLPTIALSWLKVGEVVPIVFTMPIWAMLFSWLILGIRANLRTLIALALGMSGIALLFVGPDLVVDAHKITGSALALAGAVLFALGTTTTAGANVALSPVVLAAWQLGLGCLPMLVAGLLFERPSVTNISAGGWWMWVYMIVGSSAVPYIAWFAALRRLAPISAAIGTLLIPVLGVIFAALFLREPVTLSEVIALVLILTGAALSSTQAPVEVSTSKDMIR